jgi:hypothetical protein
MTPRPRHRTRFSREALGLDGERVVPLSPLKLVPDFALHFRTLRDVPKMILVAAESCVSQALKSLRRENLALV